MITPFGYIAIVPIAFVLLVIFIILFIASWHEEKERESFNAEPTSEPLREKYKGLIASISLITEPKDQIKSKIDSVKNLEDAGGLGELYKVRGVGQTFRAIKPHLGRLEVCWLLHTEEAVKAGGKEVVEYFIKKFGKGTVKVRFVPLEDLNKIESVYKAINEIYLKEIEEENLEEKDVIADLTGGTAIMSSAMTLACISPDRKMEYVEQRTYNLIKIDENITEVIFRHYT